MNNSGGISLQDLKNRERMEQINNMAKLQQMQQMKNLQYNQLQHLQQEQGHNSQHAVHQNQHQPYVIPQVASHQPNSITNLAQDINMNIPNTQHNVPQIITVSSGNNSLLSKIPARLREPLIIIILFVLLSLPFVKNNIGKYIKQINPDATGNVPLIGIVIYGMIFAGLFDVMKRFLPK